MIPYCTQGSVVSVKRTGQVSSGSLPTGSLCSKTVREGQTQRQPCLALVGLTRLVMTLLKHTARSLSCSSGCMAHSGAGVPGPRHQSQRPPPLPHPGTHTAMGPSGRGPGQDKNENHLFSPSYPRSFSSSHWLLQKQQLFSSGYRAPDTYCFRPLLPHGSTRGRRCPFQ